MISTKYIEDIDIDIIKAILEIDSIVYPEHLQGTFDEVYGRFKANRDTLILLFDEYRVIGYFCMFPIKDKLYNEILNSDRFYDSDIPSESIVRYEPHNTYKLYAISTVIHPDYQGKGLSKLLVNGFYAYMMNKKKNNIFFSSILTTAVTNGGDYLSRKLGFEKKKTLNDGYVLYELLIDDTYYTMVEKVVQ